ncbi:hypothetical protein MBLNU230_g0609t2 [Neophaeotheca triangularis]
MWSLRALPYVLALLRFSKGQGVNVITIAEYPSYCTTTFTSRIPTSDQSDALPPGSSSPSIASSDLSGLPSVTGGLPTGTGQSPPVPGVSTTSTTPIPPYDDPSSFTTPILPTTELGSATTSPSTTVPVPSSAQSPPVYDTNLPIPTFGATPDYSCPVVDGETVRDQFGNTYTVNCDGDAVGTISTSYRKVRARQVENFYYASYEVDSSWNQCFEVCQNNPSSIGRCTSFVYASSDDSNGIGNGAGTCLLKDGESLTFADNDSGEVRIAAILTEFFVESPAEETDVATSGDVPPTGLPGLTSSTRDGSPVQTPTGDAPGTSMSSSTDDVSTPVFVVYDNYHVCSDFADHNHQHYLEFRWCLYQRIVCGLVLRKRHFKLWQ